MAWHVVEMIADGRRYLGTYETEEEARAHFAHLIDEPAYEDVLFVLEDGDGEKPPGEAEVPPLLGHSAIDEASNIAREAVEDTRRPH
jgi:hypothetical protein